MAKTFHIGDIVSCGAGYLMPPNGMDGVYNLLVAPNAKIQECADHQWTDWCPYEGLDCPPDVLARKAAAEAELAVRLGSNPSLDDLIPPPTD